MQSSQATKSFPPFRTVPIGWEISFSHKIMNFNQNFLTAIFYSQDDGQFHKTFIGMIYAA
jgi:hypothetical protein